MHYILLLLGLGLFSSQIQSSPTPRRTTGSFKVERIRQSSYVADGPRALKKAYAKFGIIPSGINFESFDDFSPFSSSVDRDAVSKAKQPDESGVVTNMPTHNDVQYLSPVIIGGQQFIMNLDTGSSDTWVFNTQLPQNAKGNHSIFDPAKSSSFSKLNGTTFNITYGDGSFASGGVGIDSVDIGGAKVAKQAIGLPTKVSASFIRDEASDGLVGLAFDRLNTAKPQKQKSFLMNLAEGLKEPVFTAQLKKGAPGSYEFGSIDKSKFNGKLSKIPVNNTRGFWEFDSSKFRIGNNSKIHDIKNGVTTAIADTGTTLLIANEEIVRAYYSQVKTAKASTEAGGFIFTCDVTLPDLFVSLADTHLAKIPGSLLNFAPVGSNTTSGEKLCFGGLQSNHGSGLQIFGDVFFKALFVVFDLRGPSLHVAGHA
ncbi:tethering complex subunit [Ophidiomyces ophidiicola]|uniref:tethering complex subunit n=1 Tax=Ophidiomyces ophidiicola TaxID=1387563 RepID=UPI0020C1EC77|nr:tethering complex subunit [Ophidiomyces ophidiicola]KAI1950434.1 tethering complex subunit [Ophidiomyces ophidiicola]KAI2053255.1 tethering complex subunit [Ophidiomyces ophidiicola]KAI2091087.1 tethering complex subunit [Ophidiomyces ophidiicola]